MSRDTPDVRVVVVERELSHPPARVWRALTQPELIADWLMSNDFQLTSGHRFELRADWGAVSCQVLEIEPISQLSYSWAARGLQSVVKWTLTPSGAGTLLRMEQSGFRPDQQQAHQGARYGWAKFISALERLLAQHEDGTGW